MIVGLRDLRPCQADHLQSTVEGLLISYVHILFCSPAPQVRLGIERRPQGAYVRNEHYHITGRDLRWLHIACIILGGKFLHMFVETVDMGLEEYLPLRIICSIHVIHIGCK